VALALVPPGGGHVPPGSLLWSTAYSDSHILCGAKEIAGVYFGDVGMHRQVFYRVQKGRFPYFREGTIGICVRVGTLRRWVEFQEHCAMLGKECRVEELADYVARGSGG
jgi:hypothetical protein